MKFDLDRDQEMEELKQLAAPLVKYLREKHHPHTAIVVTDIRAVLTEDVMGIPFPFDTEGSQKAEERKATRVKILMSAKAVYETANQQEVMQMIQSGNWVAVNAYFRDGDMYWCLINVS